jgi:hypothetical protein
VILVKLTGEITRIVGLRSGWIPESSILILMDPPSYFKSHLKYNAKLSTVLNHLLGNPLLSLSRCPHVDFRMPFTSYVVSQALDPFAYFDLMQNCLQSAKTPSASLSSFSASLFIRLPLSLTSSLWIWRRAECHRTARSVQACNSEGHGSCLTSR